jgi:pteridine reductase
MTPSSAAGPLEGRVALVTGGAVRVGRSIALALARAGADVAIHYAHSADQARGAVDEVVSLGRRSVAIRADLTDPETSRQVVEATARSLGGLDLLVHSAANFLRRSLEQTDAAVWDEAMNLNARAGLLLAREAAPLLRARAGRIVFIADLAAYQQYRGYLAHSVSKAAIVALTRALAVELAPAIAVNAVAPGTVLPPEQMPAEELERIVRRIPAGRAGRPEDVASAVLFLATGPAYITGAVIPVDGGRLAV